MERVSTTLLAWLGTTQAFAVILVIFVLNSTWLALSAIYPLPFDEYFHFGIIKLYAQQWSPFISIQPPEASIYGDITRLPSYLYHYLMSWPFKLIEQVIPSEEGQIIALRLINIIMFALGIVLIRHLLLKANVSRKIIHVALLFFVVTPIVPFLAAHINYDNSVMILAPLALILGYQIIQSRKPDIRSLLYLIILGLLGCLIKETFLPIIGLVGLYALFVLIWRYRISLPSQLWKSFLAQKLAWRFGMAALLILSVGMFSERYVVNQLQYGDYSPSCEKIQSIEVCSDNMPWFRNYQNKLNPPEKLPYGNPISYTQHWVSKIMRGFFAVFSHTPTLVVSPQEPFGPIVLKALLPLPIVLASLLSITSLVVVTTSIKRLWKQPFYRYAVLIVVGYAAVVWFFNLSVYQELAAAQAIQARYFLPLLPLALVIVLQSYAWVVRQERARALLLIAFGGLYIYSGGILGWLIRADTTWYWQQPTVIQVNQSVQEGLKRIIIH
jgi:hypothetical protein